MKLFREDGPDAEETPIRQYQEVYSMLDNQDMIPKENKKFFSRRYYMFSRFD